MSKRLAKIKTDIDLSINLNDLKPTTPNHNELTKVLDELEFRTIKERLERIGLLKVNKEEQLNFFDSQQKS